MYIVYMGKKLVKELISEVNEKDEEDEYRTGAIQSLGGSKLQRDGRVIDGPDFHLSLIERRCAPPMFDGML